MAVTITQQPTSPNAAYTRLPYVVSGSVTTSEPQYQYVMDVYKSGSTNRIARLTQTPNPQGVAVFDPSRIFQGELSEDPLWKTVGVMGGIESNRYFNVSFGEQYSTSVSSSVTVYPGLASTNIHIMSPIVDPNNGVSFNFPSSSYYPPSDNLELTNDPDISSVPIKYKSISVDDYQTVSYLENLDIGGLNWDEFSIVIKSGSSILYSKYNEPIYNFEGSTVYVGVGPRNLLDYNDGEDPSFDAAFAGDWTSYEISVSGSKSGVPGPPEYSSTTYYSNEALDESICNKEKTRFAFINRFGVWDYYNNFNPVKRSSNIQRENVTLPQLDYSNISSPYNVNNRGQKDYYTEVKDRFVVDTEYVDKETANWLEELLDSPSVYIQRGDCFIPVVLTNSNYQVNNNTSRNKLFQYTIEFEPANQPYGDWNELPTSCISGDIEFQFDVTSSVPLGSPNPPFWAIQSNWGHPAFVRSYASTSIIAPPDISGSNSIFYTGSKEVFNTVTSNFSGRAFFTAPLTASVEYTSSLFLDNELFESSSGVLSIGNDSLQISEPRSFNYLPYNKVRREFIIK